MDAKADKKDWKDIGFAHYKGLFSKLDADECSLRCAVPFKDGAFSIRLMGKNYKVHHPDFKIEDGNGVDDTSLIEKVLILRYLDEGEFVPWRGSELSYREIPWGEVYFKSFEGRCIKRLARTFADNQEILAKVIKDTPSLKGSDISKNNFGRRFEFFSNLYLSIYLWSADDEFPAQAQILFDDNVPAAFSAEDLAGVGEVVINRLKAMANQAASDKPKTAD